MKRFLSGLLLALMVSISAFAQSIKVKGKVTEQETGETLPGVNIMVEGKTIGTITDLDGNYSIEVGANETLVFSFTGMKSVKEVVNGRTEINVMLAPDSEVLDEVMVVAYGTTTKEAYTGSAQVVSSEVIEARPVVSFEKALQGTTSGLQVTSSSGQPGSSATIRVRGIGSLNAGGGPLIVLDGVPFAGSFSDINPNDIASVNTIKDAAGAALYGSRAANGVIIVTTKQGSKDNTKISFSAQFGRSQRISDGYALMNSTDFYQHSWMGLYNQATFSDEPSTIAEAKIYADERVKEIVGGFNPFGVENPLDDSGRLIPGTVVNTDTDWRDLVYKTGLTKSYNLNVAGGNEKTSAYFSLGYFKDDGTVLASDFERYSGKINVSHQVNKFIKAGMRNTFSLSTIHSLPNGGAASNPIRAAEQFNAATPVRLGDGNYNWDNAVSFDFNPVGLAEMDLYESKSANAIINAFLDVNILKNLVFKSTASFNYLTSESITYYNPEHGNGAGVGGRGTQGRSSAIITNFTNVLTFDKQFDKHYIQALAGTEVMQTSSSSLSAGATDFALPGEYHLAYAAQPSTASSGGGPGHHLYTPLLSNITYEYDGKLNLSASYRVDGSSRFGEDAKFGHFYSFGAGWTVSQSSFMPQIDWLNHLRLRASYGTSGNSAIGNFASLGLYSSGFNYGGTPGVGMTQLANPALGWEKQGMMNLGTEFTVLDRVTTTVEYYIKNSHGLLYTNPLSRAKGSGGILTNLAEMKNSGIELLVEYNAIKKKDFTYTVALNLTTNTNEILNLNGQTLKSGGTKIVEEGGSLYRFFLAEWAGVNPDNGDPMWYTNQESDDDPTNEGEPESAFIDPLGTGRMVTSEYNDAERVRFGLALPDYYGGINNMFTYKNFDLSFYIYFSQGASTYNSDYAANMHDGNTPGTNLAKDALNAWSPTNRYTDVPRYSTNNSTQSSSLSSRFLEDASYIRLKNISFGYNLPAHVCKTIGLRGGKLFMSAENVWTSTNYKGFDPEGALNGTTSSNVPGVKTYTVGFKLDL